MTTTNHERIGLLGGTFDPIHLGHLLAAQEAHEQLRLSRVILMPAFIRPHKDRAVATSAADRLAMCHAAVADDPRFEVSDLEIQRGGPSYTVDTVSALRARHPGEIAFLLGSDSVRELPYWYNLEELVELCTLVVLARPGFEPANLDLLRDRLTRPQIERIADEMLSIPLIEISSTDVRRRLADGRSIRYLVPRAVEDYIHAHGLYR